jgi:hypothetical protein
VAGGYGGGTTYHKTAEVLDPERGWQAIASMRDGRSGLAMGFGPDGCVYAAGESVSKLSVGRAVSG